MSDTQGTRIFYDALSALYDQATANGAWTPNVELQEEVKHIDHKVETALDLGCGTGQTLKIIHDQFSGAKSVAADFSEKMVQIARQKFPTTTFYLSSLPELLEAPSMGNFDLLTAIGVLEFVPELPIVIPRLLDHLNVGGTGILTYEPLIPYLPGQDKPITVGSGSAVKVDSTFTTYRWTMNEILGVLGSGRCQIHSQRLFKSYVRGEQPVIYHMLRLRRMEQ
jgi:SAM-dependent methyltransferase